MSAKKDIILTSVSSSLAVAVMLLRMLLLVLLEHGLQRFCTKQFHVTAAGQGQVKAPTTVVVTAVLVQMTMKRHKFLIPVSHHRGCIIGHRAAASNDAESSVWEWARVPGAL